MRLKSVILCSASATILGLAASPAAAQPGQQNPQAGEEQTPQAQEMPADPEAGSPQRDDAVQGEDEAIVVTGLRQSLRSAQNIKRNSEQIVDAIVAEDIGKLPDVTVAETAARIPGIQVDRARGEAAGQVLLRGLPDLTTTYNGREIFTAETRSVALGDFPAGGISAIEAFKSTTANLIEGGIAGLINVRSRRPFDFAGRELSGSFRYAYATQSGEWDPNGNFLFSDRWDAGDGEIGFLVNVSYQQLRYLDSARWNSGDILTFRTTTGQEFQAPHAVGIFYGAGERRRPSVNGAIQWRPAPELEFYVDALWQGYRDRVADRLFENRLWGGGAQFTNLQLRPGTNQAQSVSVDPDPPPFLFQGATFRSTDTYQVAIGGSYDTGRLRLSGDVARTDSRFDMSLLSYDFEPNQAPNFNVNFDVPRGPGGVEWEFVNFDPNNPANYNHLGFFDRDYVAAGDDWQVRGDLEWDTGIDFLPDLRFGARWTTRDAYQENGERYCATWMGSGCTPRLPLTGVPVQLDVFRAGFQGANIQPTRTWVAPTYRSIRDNVEALRALHSYPPGPPPRSRVFTADEDTFAIYGQAGYEFDLGGIAVDGNVGLRAVRTELFVRTSDVSRSGYSDYLPNASMRLRFTDQIQLRLAATQTRTRPTFQQMAPIIFFPPPPCFSEVPLQDTCRVGGAGGNPNLRPIESNNYDASLEYYFSRSGYASLAVFRRDFNGFITNFNQIVDHPVFGPGRAQVNIPVNGGEGSIQGFEAAFQTFFDFLPGPLSGLGVQANLTHLDDEQEFPPEFNITFGEPARLLGVSRWSYNLNGMYEYGGVSARLSYNYRSRWNTAYVPVPGGGFTGEFVDGVDRLDWSSSYTPFENVTFEFNYSNILGNPFRNFRRFNAAGDVYPRDVRYEESIISLGVRFRL
ncbi:MAG: TonB-dependent receptor [Pseudomonadota bacterium]|nr:TonB-dependent receptor [Pseudomonadota bacterium]